MTLEMAPLVHPHRSLSLSSPLKGFISWISWRNTCSVHMLERLPVSSSSIKEMDNTSKTVFSHYTVPVHDSQSLNWNTEERKSRDWILTEALWLRAVLQGKMQVQLRSEAHWTLCMIVLYHLECLLSPDNISIFAMLNLSSHWLQDCLYSQITSPATGKSSHLVACITM